MKKVAFLENGNKLNLKIFFLLLWISSITQSIASEKKEIVSNLSPTIVAGTLTNPTICGGNDGSISFTTTNIPDDYYTLNFKKDNVAESPITIWIGSNAFILENLAAGSYSDFSIEVGAETATLTTAQVLNNPILSFTIGTFTNPTYCGADDGTITFSTTNIPDDAYTLNFKKDNVSQTPIIIYVNSNTFILDNFAFPMTAGSYSNFSMSVGSCPVSQASPQVLINPTLTLTAGTKSNPTACGSDGGIEFSTTNILDGTYTLNYKKNTVNESSTVYLSADAFTLQNLGTGSYSDFSISFNGCSATLTTAQVLNNPTITLAAGTLTQPTSCSSSNGSIAFTTTNAPSGQYSLSYKKNTVSQTSVNVNIFNNAFTLNNLGVGSYADFTITLGDCSASLSTAQVLTGTAPTLTAGTKTNLTNCGGSNGSIAFTTTNIPNALYTLSYKKDGVSQTRSVTVSNNTFTLGTLTLGSYSDFSIPVGSCTASSAAAQAINNPTFTLTAGTITKPTVCGGTNGSIAFTTTNITANGTYVLQYKKDGVATSANVSVSNNAFTLSNLSAASYADFSLSVNNCAVTLATAQVVNNPTPTLTAGTLTHPTTCTSTNGSIAFTTTFLQNIPYTLNYKKNNVAQSISLSVLNNAFTLGSLSAGTYSDFSLSSGACTAITSSSKTLNTPNTSITASIIGSPTTCGGSNGFIQFSTTNIPAGAYTLSYKRNSVAQTSSISVSGGIFQLQNLTAGSYSDFSLELFGNCSATFATAQVLTELSPTLNAFVQTNTTCSTAFGDIGFTSSNIPDGNYTLSYKKNNVSETTTITISNNSSTLTGVDAGYYNDFSITYELCTATASQKVTMGSFNIWTGATSQDWHTNSNWSMEVTPISTLDVKIPAWATNQPTLSTTENISGIIVENGATLIITSSGNLTINFPVYCLAGAFFNQGTVQNNGMLVLGSGNTLGAYALSNYGNFNNNSGATLIINRSTDTGLYNLESGVFTNAGLIKIGNITSVGSRYSIWNAGVFTNSNTIEIDRATTSAIYNKSSTAVKAIFNNSGNILIGKYNANVGHGIANHDNFNNNSGGTISISRVIDIGIVNSNIADFVNAGSINLGVEAGAMNAGITNNGNFNNNSSGSITIQNAYDGLINSVGFTNNGTIEINAISESYEGFKNHGTLTNNSCAKLIVLIGRGRNSSGTINNLGLFQIANNFYNHSVFNNNGILAYGLLETTINPVAITNNDVIVGPVSACGELISSALQIGGANSFTIANTWYSDAAQTNASGTYTTATNNFVRMQLVSGTAINYLSITDNSNNCVRIVPINITLTASPALTAGTVTPPSSCSATDGSIAFSTALTNGTYNLNYSKGGIAQTPVSITVASNAFSLSSLSAGNYSNFSIISAGCTSIDATTKTVSPSSSQATQNITTAITSGTVIILAEQTITATNQISNASVTYKAGQSITLLPGFQASGSKFQAVIGNGCN